MSRSAAAAAAPAGSLSPPTGQFCAAVRTIYELSGCGSVGGALPAGNAPSAVSARTAAVPVLAAPKAVKKPSAAAVAAAVHRAAAPGLTSVRNSCLLGKDGGCVMLHKRNGVGKLPILSIKALKE
eukprot:TRINITY_DN50942_c0_g1_i1.p1 TRINITY_DN50942_c0_g1~~TRINITY_DN50942_c0_g1_i1.p1  ORF type:complete len:125 (+),score=41.88 TRINITY_DN50942_c0_g1_i1:108-482(+)